MATGLSAAERVYIVPETTPGTIANTAGVPTLTAAHFMRHTSCRLTPTKTTIQDPDKDPSGDRRKGSPGARAGTWSLSWAVRPRGSSPWRPDWAAVVESAMELAGTSPTSGEYVFDMSAAPTAKAFTLWDFRGVGTDLPGQVAFGCVVAELKVTFSAGDNVTMEASGPCLWIRDAATWTTDTGIGAGGLTTSAFPTEPSSPVGNGVPVNALNGVATIDGTTAWDITQASVTIQTGWALPNNRIFRGAYGSAPERPTRSITADLSMIEEGTAAWIALRTKARNFEEVAITLESGTLTNNRFQISLPACVLPEIASNDSALKWAADLAAIDCYPAGVVAPVKIKVY